MSWKPLKLFKFKIFYLNLGFPKKSFKNHKNLFKSLYISQNILKPFKFPREPSKFLKIPRKNFNSLKGM